MNKWLSIYLLAPFLGWFLAHTIKVVMNMVKADGKRMHLSTFFKSGGMPSAHSAVMVATLTVIGMREGIDSAIFGLAMVVTAIVIYDALNVRRSVGEQGEVLRQLSDKLKVGKSFFNAKGHTVAEVTAGVLLGLVTGWLLLQIL
jgi:uncharacterized protein